MEGWTREEAHIGSGSRLRAIRARDPEHLDYGVVVRGLHDLDGHVPLALQTLCPGPRGMAKGGPEGGPLNSGAQVRGPSCTGELPRTVLKGAH